MPACRGSGVVKILVLGCRLDGSSVVSVLVQLEVRLAGSLLGQLLL
jgi:hypothetical protein